MIGGLGPMQFDIVTIFPAMIEQALAAGVVGRPLRRRSRPGRPGTVDDAPEGGGRGMVRKPGPIFRALDAIQDGRAGETKVLLTTPQGTRLTESVACRLSRCRQGGL